MKHILTPIRIAWFIILTLGALMIFSLYSSAHCYPSYMWLGSTTTLSSSTISSSFVGNKNFQTTGSYTTVFSTAVNFTGWNRLNFETKVYVKAPINFPSGKGEVGFYGNNKADYISMNDSDIIYAEGSFEIATLISNNSKPGQYNVIFTSDSVKIAGAYYKPRDTFYSTPGNKETAVIITDCRGVSLPLEILQFSAQIVKDTVLDVSWMLANQQPVELQYSRDGQSWETVYSGALSFFTIAETNERNFVRLKVKQEYSEVIFRIVVRKKNSGAQEIYDVLGRKIDRVPETPGVYFIR